MERRTYDVPARNQPTQSSPCSNASQPLLSTWGHGVRRSLISICRQRTKMRTVKSLVSSHKEKVALLTSVISANAMIWDNLMKELNDATKAGFPGGCWKAKAASSFSQYSSSTSTGRSRSKLCKFSVICHKYQTETAYSASRVQHGLPT
jgi:hypothetical protein